MTDSANSNLFASTAWYYAQYRPTYGERALEFLQERFALSSDSKVLDLGSGPGTIAIPLAEYVGEVVAIDPNEEMIAEGKAEAERIGADNVDWVIGSDEDIDDNSGPFTVTTIGRAFHWMDQERTLERLYPITEPGGGLVLVGEGDWVWSPSKNWQRVVKRTVQDWLGEERRAGDDSFDPPEKRYEQMICESEFSGPRKTEFTFKRSWDVDSVVGYLYSTSYCSPSLVGDQKAEFESDLRERLADFDEDGLVQDVTLEFMVARK